jgi:polar amino acid transport system permease protein
MAVSALGLIVAVWILPAILRWAPEPIAGAAAEFGAGARTTLALTAVSAVLGLLLGVVIGLMRVSPSPLLRQLSGFYVWVIRGTPLVVQLLFVYFVIPTVVPVLRVSDFASAVVALGLNVAAYNAEILRACLQAIPKGQFDAARSLGLRRSQMMRRVILPQAFRVAVPPLVNNIIGLLKDSSLAYVIGVVELSLVGNRLQAATFRPVPVFVTTAAVYLFMTTFLSSFSAALERRLARES